MSRIISYVLFIGAAFMVPAVFVSLGYSEHNIVIAFLKTIAVTVVAGAVFYLLGSKAQKKFYAREGLVCVGLAWVALSLTGALPFVFSGEIPHYIDALFEIVSGFTTTGASVVKSVEDLSKGILYWRSFSHWIGGMGVLVFVLAIIPVFSKSSGSSFYLLRAESPGPDVGKMTPRIRQTAMLSYIMYIVLTVLDVIFLLIGHMPLFDSICVAFGTAGTGGFGVRNDSIASYTPFAQNVCTVFMIMFGVNFGLYYHLIRGKALTVLKDEEFRFYIFTYIAASAVIILNLKSAGTEVTNTTVRNSFFTAASIMTTTGLATTDFNLWPSLSKAVLLFLMFCGASAGSTGGGIKCSRVIILFKSLRRNVHHYLHPNRVQTVRYNGKTVDEEVVTNTNIYLTAYVMIVICSVILVSIDGFSFESNFSAVMATFNNIGPGFDVVGPTGNFAAYSYFSKIIFIADMLAGRLEIFPILVFFSRSTWKRS